MIPRLKIWGVIGKFRGSEFFFMFNNFLFVCTCVDIKGILKNVLYRKIMVVLKLGACFTIGRPVIDGFCYIFCFMGIMQWCVACS